MRGDGRKLQVASPLVVGVLAFPVLVPSSFHLIKHAGPRVAPNRLHATLICQRHPETCCRTLGYCSEEIYTVWLRPLLTSVGAEPSAAG
jgi:hypothetical protein